MNSYAVWLKDLTGARYAVFDVFREVQARVDHSAATGGGGTHLVSLPYVRDVDREKVDALAQNHRIEVWRKLGSSPWYLLYEGLHLRRRFNQDESGNLWFASVGRNYGYLLRRRRIVPPTGDSHYVCLGPACDVMRELVRYQMGSLAAAARQMENFTVEADDGLGALVYARFRYDRLDEALKKIADMSQEAGTRIWYDIVSEPEGSVNLVFQAGVQPRGTDRRTHLTYSPESGNMYEAELVEDYLDEINVVLVGGSGADDDRAIVPVGTATGLARCEGWLDGRAEEGTAEWTALGNQELAKKQVKTQLSFKGGNTPACVFDVDWMVGDWALAKLLTTVQDVVIDSVLVTLSQEGETITPNVEELT